MVILYSLWWSILTIQNQVEHVFPLPTKKKKKKSHKSLSSPCAVPASVLGTQQAEERKSGVFYTLCVCGRQAVTPLSLAPAATGRRKAKRRGKKKEIFWHSKKKPAKMFAGLAKQAAPAPRGTAVRLMPSATVAVVAAVLPAAALAAPTPSSRLSGSRSHSSNGGGGSAGEDDVGATKKNVLGGPLKPCCDDCSDNPTTGFFRDNYCRSVAGLSLPFSSMRTCAC